MAATLIAPPVPAARATLTPDDLLALEAEHDARYELVNGELKERDMTSPEHGVIALNFGSELRAFVRSGSLGVVMIGARFLLRDEPSLLRIPDAAFIARSHLPIGRLRGGHFQGAPDLAVEVVSPHDKASELAVKIADYLAAGTQQVWIVEPSTRTVAVYRPGGAARVYGAADTLDGGDLLPGLALPVGELFDYGVAAPDTNAY